MSERQTAHKEPAADPETVSEAEPEIEPEIEPETEPERRGFRASMVLALVVVAASLAYAAWFGVSWWRSAADAGSYAETRDAALHVGEQGIANLTTMDHNRFDEGMSRWRDSATGALRDSLVQDTQESKTRIESAKTSTTGTVVDAAVTELDERAGTATVIAVVEVSVRRDGAEPVVRRNRFRAELARTDDGWKLSALTAVPVGAA